MTHSIKWRVRSVLTSPTLVSILLALVFLDLHLDQEAESGVVNPDSVETIVALVLYYFIALFLVRLLYRAIADVQFRTDSELRESLARCIKNARVRLDLVSPYWEPGNVVVEELLAARRRGVDVRLIIRSSQASRGDALKPLSRLTAAGVRVWVHECIHAKLCISERRVVISSLNLVTGSIVNSLEAGIDTSSRRVRADARKYLDEMILKSDLAKALDVQGVLPSIGFCIRTRSEIPFDPSKPVEREEYYRSKKSRDGSYCHLCGKPAKTSIRDPFCDAHARWVMGTE